MTDSKRRIEWVDAAKGIGILMVMFGHNWLDNRYCYWFYSFHMPLFFLLAGVTFSDRRTPVDFVWHKAKCLLVPYLFFMVCNLAFRSVLSYSHGDDYDIVSDFLGFVLQQRYNYLWFLTTLFLSEILVYILSRCGFLKEKKVCTGGVLVLVVLHAIGVQTGCINYVWNIDLVPMASAYIILGKFYNRESQHWFIEKNNKNKLIVMVVLFLLSIFVATINYTGWGNVDIFRSNYGSLPLFYVAAISATYAVVLLLKLVRISRLLLFLGVNSLLYYGLHRMVIEILFVVWGKLGVVYDKVSLYSVAIASLNVVLTVVILCPVVIFIKKRCPWVIGKF